MPEWHKVRGTRIGRTTEKLAPDTPPLNEITAYGALTDSDKFVALPARRARGRWVELRLPSGNRAVVPVGDLGPGHSGVNDPYWENKQQPKYKAGIDLSQELWEELGLEGGEVTVEWRFCPPPKHRLAILKIKGKISTYKNSKKFF